MIDWWPAPAKLNLFLHITGRRDDGYHSLQTLFQFLDFGDRLAFELRPDGAIRRMGDVPGVASEQDLIVRAARLLQLQAGVSVGADIQIDKRLPLGGGLGGGSSDAATTLVALNHLWQVGMEQAQLMELGLQLGADVPVFIHGHAAWAEGVGEQLVDITVDEPWFVVVIPPCHVVTGDIFSDPELKRDCQPITIDGFLSGQGLNVCESVVRERYPQVASALEWLSDFGAARMSGTGACVFVAFADRQQAQQVFEQLPPAWGGFIARGLNRSPLLEKRVAVIEGGKG
jgi:4-diphosphocytidyl-2-C-methyl-D-erythritol kinase